MVFRCTHTLHTTLCEFHIPMVSYVLTLSPSPFRQSMNLKCVWKMMTKVPCSYHTDPRTLGIIRVRNFARMPQIYHSWECSAANRSLQLKMKLQYRDQHHNHTPTHLNMTHSKWKVLAMSSIMWFPWSTVMSWHGALICSQHRTTEQGIIILHCRRPWPINTQPCKLKLKET